MFVKVYNAYTANRLEIKINKFMSDNQKNIEIIEIKYKVTFLCGYSAMIVYKN